MLTDLTFYEYVSILTFSSCVGKALNVATIFVPSYLNLFIVVLIKLRANVRSSLKNRRYFKRIWYTIYRETCGTSRENKTICQNSKLIIAEKIFEKNYIFQTAYDKYLSSTFHQWHILMTLLIQWNYHQWNSKWRDRTLSLWDIFSILFLFCLRNIPLLHQEFFFVLEIKF